MGGRAGVLGGRGAGDLAEGSFAALRLERELNPEGTHPGQVRGGAAGPSRDRKGGDTAR